MRWIHHRILVQRCLPVLLLGALLGAPVSAEPPKPEMPDALPRGASFPAADHLAVEGVSSPALPATTAVYVPWSRTVYQGWVDNNWEIFASEDDGSGRVRLTNDAGADIDPRLNRGSSQIVFASNRSGNYEIYRANANGTGLVQLTSNTTDDVSPAWSPDGAHIAFQAYRDGQAEVYVMNADGTNQVRLTNSPNFDGQPAWSPAGDALAFTAYRNGQWRIWRMDANGANQTQVSNQPYSADPIWSPDGLRIAYDADADQNGWTELWLMDANGANAASVYTPGGTTDAYASGWSPNGEYVAYTYAIYQQFNGNWYLVGSSACYFRVFYFTTTCMSAGGMHAWGPDWQSTDITPPNSTVATLPATSPSPFTVRWSGTDAASGIYNYDVQVREDGGGWTDWQTTTWGTSGSYAGTGGHTYAFRVRARDLAGNLEAWPGDADASTAVEALPPQSTMVALPPFLRGLFELAWAGQDLGGSGIQGFDVQRSSSLDPTWIYMQVNSPATSVMASGEPGLTYYFRVRATDRAGNVEAWPGGSGSTQTTIYNWQGAGQVRDNAGAPISGASLNVQPLALNAANSDAAGRYAVLGLMQSAPSVYTVTWSKTGYGLLPPGQLARLSDVVFPVVLPPADNQVVNWDFEAGGFAPGGWETAAGPFTPTLSVASPHTGDYAALLGVDAGWTGAVLSETVGANGVRQTALDGDGTLHLVWTADILSNGQPHLYYMQRPVGAGWSSPVTLTTVAGNYVTVALVTEGGKVHVAWHGPDGLIYYRNRSGGGVWSGEVALSTFTSSTELRMGADATGRVHILWRAEPDVWHRERTAAGVWLAAENLSNDANWSVAPELVVEPSGTVHAAWRNEFNGPAAAGIRYRRNAGGGGWSATETVGTGYTQSFAMVVEGAGQAHLAWVETPGDREVNYARRLGGSWTGAELITKVNGDQDIKNIRLAVDPSGGAHVTWDQGGHPIQKNINYAHRAPAGGWSPPEPVTMGGSAQYPELTVDGSGGVWLLWGGYGTGTRVWLRHRSPAGGWSNPEVISGTVGLFGTPLPQLLLDSSTGAQHIVFFDYYQGRLGHMVTPLASSTGTSQVWQAVNVPVTMTAPTLSFLYRAGGLAEDRPFRVLINDRATTTPVYSATSTSLAWTHAWANLDNWAGETVTVTFEVNEAAGEALAWAYVDEVSLGAAHPDAWVSVEGALAGLPGDTVTYTVRYANLGGAPTGPLTVSLTLDPDLVFVGASPPPISAGTPLTWNVGSLPAHSAGGSIVITATLGLGLTSGDGLTTTVGISTVTGEIELANNAADWVTLVSQWRLFLPIVAR